MRKIVARVLLAAFLIAQPGGTIAARAQANLDGEPTRPAVEGSINASTEWTQERPDAAIDDWLDGHFREIESPDRAADIGSTFWSAVAIAALVILVVTVFS